MMKQFVFIQKQKNSNLGRKTSNWYTKCSCKTKVCQFQLSCLEKENDVQMWACFGIFFCPSICKLLRKFDFDFGNLWVLLYIYFLITQVELKEGFYNQDLIARTPYTCSTINLYNPYKPPTRTQNIVCVPLTNVALSTPNESLVC